MYSTNAPARRKGYVIDAASKLTRYSFYGSVTGRISSRGIVHPNFSEQERMPLLGLDAVRNPPNDGGMARAVKSALAYVTAPQPLIVKRDLTGTLYDDGSVHAISVEDDNLALRRSIAAKKAAATRKANKAAADADYVTVQSVAGPLKQRRDTLP